jgi:predicted AlkP superfamily pyrophosphatase or phosphodiesterase
MVTRFRWVVLPGVLVALAVSLPWSACSHAGSRARHPVTVILISLDGTHPDDVAGAPMPTLASLARRGASADRLLPVFPTNTFPNHVSLVTGVSPERHGIVNNVFLDPERGLFRYSNDPGWIQAEPLWSIAERHGVSAASFHWIGSEGPWRNGSGPSHWRAFDPDTPEEEKVDQILRWLFPEAGGTPPRLVTTWFRGADRAGHAFGPGSAEARHSLREQDRAIARLVAGLEARGALETTIVAVVSDHGMAPVANLVDLQQALDASGIGARVLGGGGVATVSIPGGVSDVERAAAVARLLGLEAIRPTAHAVAYATDNARCGDLVVMAPVGTAISGGRGAPMRGSHGYPPEEPSMAGLFIVAGGGVAVGIGLGDARNLDVAPTVLAWLGIEKPATMEGRAIPELVTRTRRSLRRQETP